jgi:hypothetical protein
MMKRPILITLAALLVLTGVWWWWPSPQSVDVTLAMSGDASATGMRDITIIVGGEKTGWAELNRGESVQASFLPEPNDVPELTLIYRLKPAGSDVSTGETQYWRGPTALPGQGYDIKILLDPQGRVTTAQHCIKPCSLDTTD